MKTTINILLLFLVCFSSYCQSNKNDTIYILFEESMVIKDYNSKISLSFSFKNKKVNTYNFKVDNLIKGFKTPIFKDLNDTLKISKKKLKINTLKKLSKIKPCDLHAFFSDTKKIYLVKKRNDIYLKYKLIYWSTQRGWEPIE